MKPVNEVLAERHLGSQYRHALAAMAIMTEIMRISPARPWDKQANDELDGKALRDAYLALFDEEFRDEGDPEYRAKNRATLVAVLDGFVAAFGD